MRVRNSTFSVLSAVFFFLVAATAQAHQIGISRGTYRIVENRMDAELAFARPEFVAAFPELDANADGFLDEKEVSSGAATISKNIIGDLKVTAGAKACQGSLKEAKLTEGDGLLVRAVYECSDDSSDFQLNLNFVRSLSRGHRHLVTAGGAGAATETVAFESNSEIHLTAGSARTSTIEALASLFRLGIEHILTGYDHLLFLFGLILIGGSIRQMLVVVSSFTLAHSMTLGLSVLGVWAPSPTFVEPAIALSIAYVGAENWVIKNAGRRWLITFPFGLIHGFGFAGALQQISLPHGQIPLALASFNLGVEAGQLAFLVITMPVVLWLRRSAWFASVGVKTMSTGILLAGIWLFLMRIG